MSATELIKQVAALSQREKAQFEELFHAMKDGNRASESLDRSNWPDFEKRLRGIYGDKIAPDSRTPDIGVN